MDNSPALTGERRKAMDADVGFTRDLGQPGKLTRPVLEITVRSVTMASLIFPPRSAPGNPAGTGDPGARLGDGLKYADGRFLIPPIA